MENLSLRSCAFALGVLGLVACGAADAGGNAENVSVADQALDNVVGTQPVGYPNVGVSYDGVSTLLNSYGDWDHYTSISPRWFKSATWASATQSPVTTGMNCDLNTWPFRDFIKGISVRNAVYGHSAKCDRTTRNTNFFSHVQNATREVKYLSRVAFQGSHTNIDDRLGTELSWDWDVGFTKAECRAHYVATGLAQIETGEVDAIVCNKVDDVAISNISAQSQCNKLVFDGTSHCIPGENCSTANAWAEAGVVANTCGKNQYLKGISKVPDSSGHIHAMYCCNFP
jgi:hypothetical protein